MRLEVVEEDFARGNITDHKKLIVVEGKNGNSRTYY